MPPLRPIYTARWLELRDATNQQVFVWRGNPYSDEVVISQSLSGDRYTVSSARLVYWDVFC